MYFHVIPAAWLIILNTAADKPYFLDGQKGSSILIYAYEFIYKF